jgi:hypothetical protein
MGLQHGRALWRMDENAFSQRPVPLLGEGWPLTSRLVWMAAPAVQTSQLLASQRPSQSRTDCPEKMHFQHQDVAGQGHGRTGQITGASERCPPADLNL